MTSAQGDNTPSPEDEKRTLPPYEGRRESADIDSGGAIKDGARVGGATGPVQGSEEGSGDVPTGGDGDGWRSQEDPAAPISEGGRLLTDEGVGPAHTKGVSRGEEQVSGG